MLNRIIFWQPFASPHQAAFLEAVATQFAGDVLLAVERPGLPSERVAQGWQPPQHQRVRVIDVSKPANHASLAAHRSADSLHVFTGFFSHPIVWSGFRALSGSRAQLGIYSEAPEQAPLTGWLKRLRGRLLAARWAARFAFVLAIGGIGCDFFERIGFEHRQIVPFGYYLAIPPLPARRRADATDETFRFVSAGQLTHRKGIDVLIEACGRLCTSGWRLDIYGDGPERGSLDRLTTRMNLRSKIAFRGTLPNDAMQDSLAAADCAVLPSRFDGWGMLVNESLAAGTPVICTRSCGAASLVAECMPDAQFPTATVASLAHSLSLAMARGKVQPESRIARRATTQSVASASTAAARALAAIDRLLA